MKTVIVLVIFLIIIFIISYYLAKWHTKTYDDSFKNL